MSIVTKNVASNLGELVQLGEGVYVCKPVASVNASISSPVEDETAGGMKDSDDPDIVKEAQEEKVANPSEGVPPPDVIFLFTWMGARLPHILKYVQAYNGLYPTATAIVVRSEAKFFWSSTKAREAYLKPIVQTLELLGCLPASPKNASTSTALLPAVLAANVQPILDTPTPKVLVHAFSNGGSWQLTTLSSLLSQSYPPTSFPSPPAQPSAVILDSCPGNGGADKTVAAFSSAIRSPILRFIVALGIRALFLSIHFQTRFSSLLFSIRLLFHRLISSSKSQPSTTPGPNAPQTMINILKSTLLSPHLLPWLTERTPRMYMYSEKDEMIPAEEVEAHADEAERRGLKVRREKFVGSGHVEHARVHPERYWGAVRGFWEEVARVEMEGEGKA